MSLPVRAIVAVVLMIGFYALALGIAGALLWLVYYDVTEWGGHGQVILFGGGISAMILWSIAPRPSRYVPSGPELTRQAQPELFAVLDEVAQATGEKMPAHVYLVTEVN